MLANIKLPQIDAETIYPSINFVQQDYFMKAGNLLRVFSLSTVFFYTTATTFAGQVITDSDRDWAKGVLDMKADISKVKNSNSIAVLNYQNVSGEKNYDSLQKGFALMLSKDLAKIDSLNVIKRNKIQALLDEYISRGTSIPDTKTIASAIGKNLQPKTIINGDIQRGTFDQLAFGTDLLTAPYKKPVQLPFVSGNMVDLVQLEKEILLNIVEQLNVKLSKKEKTALMTPLSESSPALEALFLGLDYSDNGQYAMAADQYKQALAMDPNLVPAKDALDELEKMDLTNVSPPPELKKQAKKPAQQPAVAVPPTSKPIPAGDEGLSTGTKIGIGVGVVALAGLALAAGGGGGGGSSDDGGNGGDTPDPTNPNQPVATIDTDSVTCAGDTVTFHFTESMNQAAGSVTVSPSFTINQGWLDHNSYQVIWSLDDYCNNAPTSITMTLTGFSSEKGAALGGTTSFNLEFLSSNSLNSEAASAEASETAQ